MVHQVDHAQIGQPVERELDLEWVDTQELVERLLPTIEEMLPGGLITTDPVTIIRYQAHERNGR